MFEVLPRDWNLKPIFTQKWASVDMNGGGGGVHVTYLLTYLLCFHLVQMLLWPGRWLTPLPRGRLVCWSVLPVRPSTDTRHSPRQTPPGAVSSASSSSASGHSSTAANQRPSLPEQTPASSTPTASTTCSTPTPTSYTCWPTKFVVRLHQSWVTDQ